MSGMDIECVNAGAIWRRWTAVGLWVAGAPLLVMCGMWHWCMCGHRAHGEASLSHLAIDYVFFALVSSALILSLWVPGKKWWFYGMCYVWVATLSALLGPLALIPYVVAGVLLMRVSPEVAAPAEPGELESGV